jgi:hypothetical protein
MVEKVVGMTNRRADWIALGSMLPTRDHATISAVVSRHRREVGIVVNAEGQVHSERKAMCQSEQTSKRDEPQQSHFYEPLDV